MTSPFKKAWSGIHVPIENKPVRDRPVLKRPALMLGDRPIMAVNKPAVTPFKKYDIKTSSQAILDRYQRPAPGITNNNFPENRLQMLKHNAAVDQARPNPADAFR